MRRLRLAAIAAGVVVFVGLVAVLARGGEERAPRAARAETGKQAAPATGRRGDSLEGGEGRAGAGDDGPVDPQAAKAELARQRARFAGSDAPRLGDRLDPAQAELDEPEDPRAERPRVVVPTSGEGAEVDGWDAMTSADRIAKARREIDGALAGAQAAGSREEREQWQARAAQALGAVRADFYAAGDEAGYAELEARIEP